MKRRRKIKSEKKGVKTHERCRGKRNI